MLAIIPNFLPPFGVVIVNFIDVILAWGWLFMLFLTLWVAWEVYLFIKRVDFTASIKWTYLQISVPEDNLQTPKAMENAIEVWGGIHKDPDIVEKLFDGYMLAWYSCELQCQKNRVRYIMVVPTVHAKFFEGVIYGQYPRAEVKEVEDYTQEYHYKNLEKTFDMFGTEIVLVKDDIYPIRFYLDYQDNLAEEDKFIDPHQALIEAYSNIDDGEQFWVQFLVKPVGAKVIDAWSQSGMKKIREISGEKEETSPGIIGQLFSWLVSLPIEAVGLLLRGPTEDDKKKEEKGRFFINAAEDAEIKGILQKTSRAGFKTKIRLIYISPAGKLSKPNISKAIGAFKQFNSFHLNSLKPDSATKTNGPNYFLKSTRRRYRKRHVLLDYQWRDFWGDASGQMFSAEELATLYHFPIKYVRAPGIEHSAAGAGGPPSNLPYV